MRRAILHALHIPETVESPEEASIEYDKPEDAGDEYNRDMPRRGPQIKREDYGAETDPSIAQQSKRYPEEHRYLSLYLHLLAPNSVVLRHAYCGRGTRRPIICVKEIDISASTATSGNPHIDAYDDSSMET